VLAVMMESGETSAVRWACPACGHERTGPFIVVRGHAIDRCRRCLHAFVRNAPTADELAGLYAESYHRMVHGGLEFYVPKLSRWRGFTHRLLARSIRRRTRCSGPVRLLEVGFGSGNLLLAVKDDPAFDAEGIDCASGPVEFGRAAGLNVHQNVLEDMHYPAGRFDFIVCLHTIEHLPDPARTLVEALRVLAPGGHLLVVTPCLSHIKARLAGRRWKYFTPPWHLHFFTTCSLRTLLSRIGFEVLACSCLSHRAHLRILARKPPNAGWRS